MANLIETFKSRNGAKITVQIDTDHDQVTLAIDDQGVFVGSVTIDVHTAKRLSGHLSDALYFE